jgi:hypothetical protein
MKIKISILFIAFLMFSTSCMRYYTLDRSVKTEKYINQKENAWFALERNNHLIVHQGGDFFEIFNIQYNDVNKTLTANKRSFEGRPLYYYEKVENDLDGVSSREFGDPISIVKQVHFFMNKIEYLETDKVLLDFNDLSEINISRQATEINALVGILVSIPVAVAGFIGLLYIICNCPHVYMDNGTEMVMTNSMFTGAKAPQLERFDYKQIPDFYPEADKLVLHVLNELNEEQFTDLVEIISVLHDVDTEVVLDRLGNFHTISSPVSPSSAIDNDAKDQLTSLLAKDEFSYRFNPQKMSDLSELKLTFNNEGNASSGKLMLRLKNTPWSGYVYNEFNKLFGENHAKWVEKNKNKTREEREKWMRQEGIKLLIDIKQNGEWVSISEIELNGEASFNSTVIPLDKLPKNTVEIRLRSGFMFWEIDYVVMDFTENKPLEHVQQLAPKSAIGSDGTDYTEALTTADNVYMIHLQKDNSTKIEFEGVNVSTELSRSLFLKSKGYYITKTTYSGKTKYSELSKFKKAGELSRFSKRLHDDLLKAMIYN